MPPIAKEDIDLFRRIDRWLATTCDPVAFVGDMAVAVVQPNNRPSPPDRLAAAQRASAYLRARERVGIKQLKKANALLLGRSEADFRKTPVWVGAPHPSVAWHVGSPPESLDGLMKTLMDAWPPHHPASLTAIVMLFRLLQIHPFADGNGRTARLVSIHPIHLRIGPACGYPHLLNRLWARAEFDIHSVSLAAQAEDTLTPVFRHLEATLTDVL